MEISCMIIVLLMMNLYIKQIVCKLKTISKIQCWTAFDLGSNVLGHHEVENWWSPMWVHPTAAPTLNRVQNCASFSFTLLLPLWSVQGPVVWRTLNSFNPLVFVFCIFSLLYFVGQTITSTNLFWYFANRQASLFLTHASILGWQGSQMSSLFIQ